MGESENESLSTKLIGWAYMIALVPTLLGVLDGVFSFARQAIGWLKTGTWTGETTWDGLHRYGLVERPAFEWVIPNAILSWFLDGARWFWLPVLGIIYAGILIGALIALSNLFDKVFKRREGSAS